MKRLLLDIDGVVNNEYTHKKGNSLWPIDPVMAALVRRILTETGAEVILISSWRYDEKSKQMVRENVCDFIDCTPLSKGLTSRGLEIREWLEAHPEVTRYAIIDDNSDMTQEQMPNFFKCAWDTGLTEEIADRVIAHLNS